MHPAWHSPYPHALRQILAAGRQLPGRLQCPDQGVMQLLFMISANLVQAHSSDQAPVQVMWAPIEFGAVLAVAAASGNVTMWQQQPAIAHPPSAKARQPRRPVQGSWEKRASFSIPSGVRDLAFAPAQNGNPQLAVACQSGLVRQEARTRGLLWPEQACSGAACRCCLCTGHLAKAQTCFNTLQALRGISKIGCCVLGAN